MRVLPLYAGLAGLLIAAAAPYAPRTASDDDAVVGQPAPTFSLPGSDGQTYQLSALKGKFVVLEWLNFGCPYVARHYRTGNMPALQKEYTAKDVVWLAIVSSAPGKQGYYEPDAMNAQNAAMNGAQTAILLDPEGDVGMQYGAKTTPHMYIIDPDGILIYKGGIDDKPRASDAQTKDAHNYVRAALDEALSGKAVTVETSRPYGCSVKYKQ